MSQLLSDRVKNMLTRGKVTEYDDDGAYGRMRGTGFAGESVGKGRDGKPAINHIENYGMTSTPPAGAEGLILSLGGIKDSALWFGGNVKGDRPKGTPPGCSVLYDHKGNVISMLGDNIGITAKGKPFAIKVGTLTIEADRVVIKSERIDLGGENGHAVKTAGGDSTKVFALL